MFLKIPEGEKNWRDRWSEEDVNKVFSHYGRPDINQMIEFLGDEWWEDLFVGCYTSDIVYKNFEGELADALWEATKNKLKQT